MEQKQITLEDINKRLLLIESALRSKGISLVSQPSDELQGDDEGEFTDEFKETLKKARKTPESEYISLEDIQKRFSNKK